MQIHPLRSHMQTFSLEPLRAGPHFRSTLSRPHPSHTHTHTHTHTHVSFQASLRRLFPTWPDVMRHHEVLRFAVGLSGHPSSASSGHPSSASSGHPSSATNGGPFPLLTFLYSSLVTHVTTQTHFPKSMLDPEVPFLRAVVCEAPDVLRDFDPIHNEFINYMSASSASLYDLYVSHQAALDVIHVPSRLYVFGPDVDYARLTFDVKSRGFGGATAWEEARCVASLENHVSAMLSFLTTLRKISAHQVVRIAYLDSANSRAYPMEKVKDVPKLLRGESLRNFRFPTQGSVLYLLGPTSSPDLKN